MDQWDLELAALTHPNALKRLAALRHVLEQLDWELVEAISQARAQGATWEQIARILDSQEGPQSL
jgi:hypothetical protein